jgi:hypothetical protein
VHFATKFIEFKNLDGEELGSAWKGWPRLVRVLPGTHRMGMRYDFILGSGLTAMFGGFFGLEAAENASTHYERTLQREAVPGHEFTVRYQKVTYSDPSKDVIYWVEDLRTGELISGKRPSQ